MDPKVIPGHESEDVAAWAAMDLRERLLGIMDEKDHWAWPFLTRPGLSRAQLWVHFRHEYQVYVRDFPVLLARVLGQGPPADVRGALAENIYEEQTGGLSVGRAHPELFLEMMEGLGFEPRELETSVPALETEAVTYRRFLDQVTVASPWFVGAAVMTIFVEGSRHERAELDGVRTSVAPEEAIAAHPLVRYYGCPPERMTLVRAHREVEGGHRRDAWRMVLAHTAEDPVQGERVESAVYRALTLWTAYRDGVARAMGLTKSPISL